MEWMKRYEGLEKSRVVGRSFTVRYDTGVERVGVMKMQDRSPYPLVLDCGPDGEFGVFYHDEDGVWACYVDVTDVAPFFSNGAYTAIDDPEDVKAGDILFIGGRAYHATGAHPTSRNRVRVREDIGEIDFRLVSKSLRYTAMPEQDGLYFDAEGRLWLKDLMWYMVDADNHTLTEIPNNRTPGTPPLEPMDYAKWTKDWTRKGVS